VTPTDWRSDLRKLAMLAIPMNIKIAFEALSWGRNVNEFHQRLGPQFSQADMPNLGLGFDSFHLFATKTPLDELDDPATPSKIFLVQLADFMWQRNQNGRGAHRHGAHLPRVPRRRRAQRGAGGTRCSSCTSMGYRGDYSFEVFNDDYQQMPLETVAARARRAALWLGEDVLRRSVALPNQMRLRQARA